MWLGKFEWRDKTIRLLSRSTLDGLRAVDILLIRPCQFIDNHQRTEVMGVDLTTPFCTEININSSDEIKTDDAELSKHRGVEVL